jgi:hypothetical protein
MSRKTTILIYDGDDFERLAELRREVDVAERQAINAPPLRMGDDPADPAQEAKAAYDAAVDEAAERAEEWEIHPIGHEEFRALLKDHPPRKVDGEDGKQVDHPDDETIGVNTETFGKALLLFVDGEDPEVRTIVRPELDPTALRKRLKRLSAGEFDSIWVAAFFLNNGAVTDPKLSKFSAATPRSSAT